MLNRFWNPTTASSAARMSSTEMSARPDDIGERRQLPERHLVDSGRFGQLRQGALQHRRIPHHAGEPDAQVTQIIEQRVQMADAASANQSLTCQARCLIDADDGLVLGRTLDGPPGRREVRNKDW